MGRQGTNSPLISGVQPLSVIFWMIHRQVDLPISDGEPRFAGEILGSKACHLCITHKCLDRNQCSQQESQCGTRTLLEINDIAPGGI
jgi:hypothetical protein